MMNKLKITGFVILACFISTLCFAEPRWYQATSLIGGTASSLDSINGQNLADGDKAIVVTTANTYYYNLDSDASGTETSPGVVNPDSNKGTKSWMLVFGPISTSNASVSTSGTGEDNLSTTVIPANLLGTTKGLRFVAAGTITGSNDAKVVKLHFGSASYTVISAAAGDAGDWRVEASVYNTAAAAQRITWIGVEADGTTLAGYEAHTQDTTAAATIKLTGTCTNGSDTVTQTMLDVRLY